MDFLNCQNIDTIFYDKNLNKASLKNYKYYRLVRHDADKVKVFDYSKSGQIQMSGSYKSIDFIDKTGPFFYYKGNRIEKLDIYEPFKYPEIVASYNSILTNLQQQPDSLNIRVLFHKNKRVRWIGYITKNEIYFGPGVFFTKKGQPKSMFTYNNGNLNGECVYYKKNRITMSGSFKDGKPYGEWHYYSKDGDIRKVLYIGMKGL